MEPAIKSLEAVGVTIKDLEGNVRPVSDILADLAGRWNDLSAQQQQNTAVNVAGRYQLSRFLALMNNWEISIDATNSALNSQGSSMQEQEIYANSLEARINKLDNAWASFSLSVGEAVLTDSLILMIEGLKDLAKSASSFVNVFGVLPALFATIGVVTVALSSKFRGLATNIIFGTQAMTRKVVATNALKVAMRGLAAATGVGLLFVGIGFVLEKLIGKYSEAKQKQEELKAETEKMASTYSENGTQIESLVAQYEKLREARETTGLSVEQEERYLQLSNEIAELMPSLVENIDAKGQAHLRSSEYIQKELGYLRDLTNLEYKTFIEGFSQGIVDINNEIQKLEDNMPKEKVELRATGYATLEPVTYELSHDELMQQMIAKREINVLEEQAIQNANKLAEAYAHQMGYKGMLAQADQELITSYIENNKHLLQTEAGIGLLTSRIEQYVVTLGNVRMVAGDAYSTEQINGFTQKQHQLFADLADGVRNGVTNWDGFKKQIGDAGFVYADVINAITNKNAEASESMDSLEVYFDAAGTQMVASVEALHAAIEEGLPLYDAQGNLIDENSASYQELTSAINGATNAKWENVDASHALFGATSDQISQMQNAIQTVQLLSAMENLNEQQKGHLSNAIAFLTQMFPHLSGRIAENIDWLFAEVEMMNAVNGASANMANALGQNGNSASKAAVGAVNTRIKAYMKERDALDKLYKYRQQVVNSIASSFNQAGIEPSTDLMRIYAQSNVAIAKGSMQLADMAYQTVSAVRNFEDVYKASGGYGGAPKGSSGSKGSKGSSSKKDKEREKYELTSYYETEKKLLDTNIARQEYLAGQYDETSMKWRSHMRQKVELMRIQKSIHQDEMKFIQNEIKYNKSLNAEERQMLKITLREKEKELYSIASSIEEMNKSIRESGVTQHIESASKAYDKLIEKAIAVGRELNMTDDTGKTVDLLSQKLAILKQQQRQAQLNVQELQKERNVVKDFPELVAKIDEEMKKWKDTSADLNVEMHDLKKQMKDVYNQIADEIINAYKEAYGKQRDLALKAHDDEVKAAEKAHRDKMEMLDKELSKRQDIINKMLEEIDQEEDNRSYEEQLAEKQKERAELQAKLDSYLLDDSIEGRRKAAELKEQLEEKDADIAEFMRKRQVELRKQALQDELSDTQEKIEKERELANEQYEEEQERLNEKREQINRYWENLIEDERAWAEIRQEILNGNIEGIQSELLSFIGIIDSNMSYLGESISQNLIDKIKEAMDALKSLDERYAESTSGSNSSGSGSNSSSGKSGSSSGNSGKGASGSSGGGSNANSLPLRKNPSGFTKPSGGWNLESLIDFMKSKGYFAEFNDRDRLFKHFRGNGSYTGSGSQNSWLLGKLKNTVGLSEGGFTGNWPGDNGKLAFLHQEEQVFNKKDTSNLLSASKILRGLHDFLPKLYPIANLKNLSKSDSMGQQVHISMPVTIGSIEGGKKGADSFFKEVNKGLAKKGVLNFNV